MKPEILELLRCPYCGGCLELVESLPHQRLGETVVEGILACHCCVFPVVAGIPVLHLEPPAVTAREALEAGHPEQALHVLLALDDADSGTRFEAMAASSTATYRELVEALGPNFEGGYFLYRFSDPTYVVARAVIEAVAGTVLRPHDRGIDVCGGSGHLTRALLGLSNRCPVVADLSFAKLWLASRFVAPGCEPVCCDGNAPLPFARRTFTFAMCSDAFQYIWTKRQFVAEMLRLVDGDGPGAVVVNHTHNLLEWSPSHGQALPPDGYHDLFESVEPRLFAEAGLLSDVVAGGPLDLSRRDDAEALAADPALTLVATRHPDVFRAHALVEDPLPHGELRLNPLYAVQTTAVGVALHLRFPTEEYEEEFGACRRYLPEAVTLEQATLDAMSHGRRSPEVLGLLRSRVVLDVPAEYY